MPERTVLERAPSRGGEIQLVRRGAEAPVYEIVSNGTFLMSSERFASEEALAVRMLAALSRGAAASGLRVLVGGLGLGLTLAAALRDPRVEHVDVVELEEAVIRWNRSHLRALNRDALADPRVDVVHADLLAFLRSTTATWDGLLIDVDNGPGWLVEPENAGLYEDRGIELLGSRTAPGGVLAVWSADPSPTLLAALGRRFVATRDERVVERHPSGRLVENAIALGIDPRPDAAPA